MICNAAVLYERNEPLVIERVEVQAPRGREVLVRLVASGVCHSDLSTVTGTFTDPLPAILGHEGAGVVVTVGPDARGLAVGDHVILSWKPSCGRCRPCGRGRPNLCEGSDWIYDGRMRDGTSRYSARGREILHYVGVSTFAEFTVVEDVCAVKVDEDLPLAPMSLIGCAVTTGVGAAVNTAAMREGDAVAVIGCGGVGLSVVQGARIGKAGKIIAVDRSDAALDLAIRLGATHAVNASAVDARRAVLELSAGGVDFAFEAVGRRDTIELASGLLARGGEAILIGVPHPDTRAEVVPSTLVCREHAIRGSYYGSASPEASFRRLARLYRDGELDLDSMVVFRELGEINDIFAEMKRGAAGRNVILFR